MQQGKRKVGVRAFFTVVRLYCTLPGNRVSQRRNSLNPVSGPIGPACGFYRTHLFSVLLVVSQHPPLSSHQGDQ